MNHKGKLVMHLYVMKQSWIASNTGQRMSCKEVRTDLPILGSRSRIHPLSTLQCV
jgi:hypothetical protein